MILKTNQILVKFPKEETFSLSIQAGAQKDWAKPCKKGPGVDGMVGWTWASNLSSVSWVASKKSKKGQQKKYISRVREVILPLCSAPVSLQLESYLCPDIESSVQEKHRLIGVYPKEGHRNDPREGTSPLCGQTQKTDQPGERRFQGDL